MTTKKFVTAALFVFTAFLVYLFAAGTFSSSNSFNNNQAFSPNTATSSVGVGTTPVALTMNEVSKHRSASDCWTVISGQVYNLTSFINVHSGGVDPILAACGTDATAAFNAKHSSRELAALPPYLIGSLGQTVAPSQAGTIPPASATNNRRSFRGQENDD